MNEDSRDTNESGSDQYCLEIPNISWLERPKEWTYTMRRHMQEVVPGVFLGPYSAASRSKLQSLLDHGITHIVCVRHAIEANLIRPNFPNSFKYLVLEIADTITENIIQHFKKVKVFIDEALNSDGRVLVHGNAGISRSAALVLAYVMETYELSQMICRGFKVDQLLIRNSSYLEMHSLRAADWNCWRAYSMVQQRRFCINPNEGFMTQLKEYEPIYQAEKTMRNGQQNLESQRSVKRTIHQIETDSRTQVGNSAMDS